MTVQTGATVGTISAVAVAAQHQASQGQARAAQIAAIVAAWRTLRPESAISDWIGDVGNRVYALLSIGQEAVASQATDYIRDALDVQDIESTFPEINDGNFAGIASDGRDLESLLAGAPIRVAARMRAGDSPARAMQVGENWLKLVATTQIDDAARAADSVAIATVEAHQRDPATILTTRTEALRRAGETDRDALLRRLREARGPRISPPSGETRREQLDRIKQEQREKRAALLPPRKPLKDTKTLVTVGYVRMLNPPSCDRCIVLAGRFYRWSAGFERHPMCDCRHIPAIEKTADDITTDPDAYFESLTREQQDDAFGKANAQAIRDGADISRVVNAKASVYTADDGHRYTYVGTRRSRRGRRSAPVLRPTVWQIYKDAKGDRAAALQLLEKFGYITQ